MSRKTSDLAHAGVVLSNASSGPRRGETFEMSCPTSLPSPPATRITPQPVQHHSQSLFSLISVTLKLRQSIREPESAIPLSAQSFWTSQ
jgi:hypothetical protein